MSRHNLNAAIKEAEADLAALRARTAKESPRAKVIAHPTRIRQAIRSILETLELDPRRARELLRKHLGTLVLTPTENGYVFDGGFLLGVEEEDPGTPAEGSRRESQDIAVAGAGFEPTTFGL